MAEEKKKNWFTSLFTDKDWDFDLAKVVGFIVVGCGIAGFFLNKDEGIVMAMLGFGAGLLGITKAKGDQLVWEKIKSILSVIGAVFTIAFCTFVLVFLRRRDSDGLGSRGADERDTAVEDGIGECENRTGRVEERIERAEDSAGRCEEHLHKAEAILREAIRRSREKGA